MNYQRSKSGRVIVPNDEGVRGYRPSDVDRYARHLDWRRRQVHPVFNTGWVKMKRIGPNQFAMAVAFGNTRTGTRDSASPATNSFTPDAGASRSLFGCIGYDNSASMSISSAVFGGVGMSPCGSAAFNATGNEYSEAYYLTDTGGLPSGANNLVVTIGGSIGDIYCCISMFTGTDQSNPVRAGSYQAVTSNSITITTQAGDATITGINGGTAGVGAAGQTLLGSSNAGICGYGADYAIIASGTTKTHTWGGTNNPAMVGFSIKAAAAAGGVFSPVMAALAGFGNV